MPDLTKAEQRILDLASQPPKRLRDFWPFIALTIFVALLIIAHGVLLWYMSRFGEEGLYIYDGRRYIEVYRDVRGFILTASFLVTICFVVACALARLLWQHKRVLHTLWQRMQQHES